MATINRTLATLGGILGAGSIIWLEPIAPLFGQTSGIELETVALATFALSVTGRAAMLAPNAWTAWGRALSLNGSICIAAALLSYARVSSASGARDTFLIVMGGACLTVLAGAGVWLIGRRTRLSLSTGRDLGEAIADEAEFIARRLPLYRREIGVDYRAFVRRMWDRAEVVPSPMSADVDGRPCRIVSITKRPMGGFYANVIVDGRGHSLIAHAHEWARDGVSLDIAGWARQSDGRGALGNC